MDGMLSLAGDRAARSLESDKGRMGRENRCDGGLTWGLGMRRQTHDEDAYAEDCQYIPCSELSPVGDYYRSKMNLYNPPPGSDSSHC